jgi:hypothetical protein
MSINTRQALSAHAGLLVSGQYDGGQVWNLVIKDLDDIPNTKEVEENLAAHRPVMFPVFFMNNSETRVPTTTAGSGDVTVNATFLCLVEYPRRISEELEVIGPKTVSVHDAYLYALLNNDDLSRTLAYNVEVNAEWGVWPHLNKGYAGFLVRQTWKFLV